MTYDQILYVCLGAAAGGFVNGLAGFGTALFALGFFLTVMSPLEAVAISVTIAAFSGLQGVWIVRHEILAEPARLARFLLPALVGIPIGVSLLSLINVDMLKIVIAVFLILYGGYFTFRSRLPTIARRTPWIDGTIGFAGGILGGAAGLSGALPTMWCSLRSWTKSQVRAVLQPFNVIVLSLTLVMLAWNGAFSKQTLLYALIAVPVSVVFAQIGIIVFHRLPDGVFQRLLIGLCFVSGIGLLLRELM